MDIQIIDRGGDRRLTLYAAETKTYQHFDGLPPVDSSAAHMRWHPLRREWIGYATARQSRTHLPSAAECPLCPMSEAERPSDIPVDDYEIAIFTNRFSAFAMEAAPAPDIPEIATQKGTGLCEVISYSADHTASLATIGTKRIALLIKALGHHITQLYQHDDIIWSLPFENRGREIGVTLDHPHGQIYSLSVLPNAIKTMADAMAEDSPLAEMHARCPETQKLAETETAFSFVPSWARYPFECWVMPKRAVDGPHQLTDAEISDLADMVATTAQKLDAVMDGPMPYTLAWQIAPKGYEGTYHFHLTFQPLKRSKTKQKFLASVEQISGLFLVDLPPERAAAILRGEETIDG